MTTICSHHGGGRGWKSTVHKSLTMIIISLLLCFIGGRTVSLSEPRVDVPALSFSRRLTLSLSLTKLARSQVICKIHAIALCRRVITCQALQKREGTMPILLFAPMQPEGVEARIVPIHLQKLCPNRPLRPHRPADHPTPRVVLLMRVVNLTTVTVTVAKHIKKI